MQLFVQSNGFALSMEAIVSIALLAGLLALPIEIEESDLTDLYIFQKENDLLKVWLQKGEFRVREMVGDVQFAFPGKNAKIIFDGKETVIGQQGGNGIASEVVFFDSSMQRHSIRLIVFN